MKLLLTSAGLLNKKVADFFVSILPKNPQDCSILMISFAQNAEEQQWVDLSKKELLDLGINKITFFNLAKDNFSEKENFDIIFVCGGNTFAILDRLRKTKLDEFIKTAVLKNKSIYLGVSAGSIIAGPDIKIAGWGSEGDKNEVGLKDLSGFNLTNIHIFPHYKDYLKEEVEEFKKQAHNPVIELTDEEAVFVDDFGYKKI